MQDYHLYVYAVFIASLTISISGCDSGGAADNYNLDEGEIENSSLITFDQVDVSMNDFDQQSKILLDLIARIEFDSIRHNKVTINLDTFYVVEGDLLMNENEYFQYKLSSIVRKLNRDTATEKAEPALVGEYRDGRVVRWPEDEIIRFCILRQSFPETTQYDTVKLHMLAAIDDWEKTCGVDFKYVPEMDNENLLVPGQGVDFIVHYYDSDGEFHAAAFFPYYPVERRRLIIDPTFFTASYSKRGMIRHELGHVMGFRHEHIFGNVPLVCQDEALGSAFQITNYDPKSVMHYYCDGVGSRNLEITNLDRDGSQKIYGPPN